MPPNPVRKRRHPWAGSTNVEGDEAEDFSEPPASESKSKCKAKVL